MKYLSMDIETTGLNPEECQVLEIGAILEDTQNPLSFNESKKFRAIIPHEFIQGSPFALNMNKDLVKLISEYHSYKDPFEQTKFAEAVGVHPLRNVAANFGYWLERECGFKPEERITVAGKNFLGFDDKFLNALPYWKDNVKINRRVIDPAILCVDWEKDESLPSLSECLKRCGIEKTVAHTSLEDAWDVIQILRIKGYGKTEE